MIKLKATIPADWRPENRFAEPGDVVEATASDDLTNVHIVSVLRAGQPIPIPSLREAVELIREHGKPDETHAPSYVETAMRSRLDDIAVLVGTAEGKGEGWADPDKLDALGIEDIHADGATGNAEEEAQERLDEYPLAVEASVTFEVVIGTGGPDDRLLFECDVDLLEASEFGRFPDSEGYTVRRVIYRYSWEDSAERVLTGEDKETAEVLARRVVPELAE